MRPLIRCLLIAAACLAVPASSQAATPFTAGSGADPGVAVGSDGSGHIVWETDAANTQVGYCRVSSEATACNRTEILTFPGSTEAQRGGSKAQVFTPAPEKVVIVAGCWNCPTGTQNRTYRWISTNNGASFGAPQEIGTGLETNGRGAWLDDVSIFVGTNAANVKAALVDGTGGVTYATGGTFVYGPEVVRVQGTTKLVAATNDLEVVKYGVYKGSPLSAANINNVANWEVDKTLPSPEPDNSDTALNSGPNGVYLTYRNFVAGDTHIGLRRFDPATNTFGGATFIEGSNPIDDASLGTPDSFQDPSGRIHVVWTTLYEGGRLRYAVSDPSGANFSAAGTLASSEGFYEPELAAGADGHGFAVWTPGIAGAIRVVPLDPQQESGTGTTTPDTTPPGVSGFGIDTSTLRPGQNARFSFQSTEAGQAVLTIEKRFKGTKKKRKGKTVCVAPKKGKKRNCTGYRKIGEIRQAVTAGRNTIEFNGRIAGRKLKPGQYRASLVVTDAAGQVSRTETVRFKVAKPKKRKRSG
jgi:hypothetical protein